MRIAFEDAEEWAEKMLELAMKGKLTPDLIELNVGSLTRCCDKYEISPVIKKLMIFVMENPEWLVKPE
ncbi:hypothetical protein ACEV6Q_24280 [Enterobacter ludwigii]|uniref:hypothetical protein n=1 Tax=Enterobacter ludwigii TaxID=299767 RepID=UPI003BEF01B8